MSGGDAVAAPTRGNDAFYAVVRALLAGFCYVWFRARIAGRHNIPAEGPFILAPVHRSNVDTLIMACPTRRPMRFMGKESMWKYGWSARLFDGLGGIPVRRGTPDREAMRACESSLREGRPIVVFPEGTRRGGPVIEEIFEGAAFLAVRTGAPIVPVGIGGSERAMPKGSRWIHPVKVRAIVGPPILPPSRETGLRGVRREVRELSEQLHTVLQGLFDQAQAAAGVTGTSPG